VIAYRPGTLWINFERLSEDDGKWVYESAYRSEYQRYVHTITVNNKDNNERKIQRRYDQPLFIQGNALSSNARVEEFDVDFETRDEWNGVSNINGLKFTVRPFNDSTTVVRVHNMDDKAELTVGLYANDSSPLLTTFYGRTVSFSKITENSLGGNM
jgi:Cft2 family RNA processing exonuclease